jgi:hypothetical protein
VPVARVVLVVVVLVLAGCGPDDDVGIANAVRRHVWAVSAAKFDAACAELAPAAQRDVIAFVARAGVPAPRSCHEAYSALQFTGSLDLARSGVMDIRRARHLPGASPKVDVVSVDGDHARARYEGSAKTVALERSGDKWLIARLDFSDAP